MTDIIDLLRNSQSDAQTRCRAIEEIQRLRAEKAPDFSGLWGLVDDYRKSGHMLNAKDVADDFEQGLTKMGVKRK